MSKPINLENLEARLRRGNKVSTEALLKLVEETKAARSVAQVARDVEHDGLKLALAKLDAVWR